MLAKSRIARNMSVMVGGAAIGQVIAMVSAPIITRLYTPLEFGTFAVYGSVLAIISGVVAGRYDFAIVLPKKDAEAVSLLVLALGIVVAFSLCLFWGGLLGGEVMLEFMGLGELAAFWFYVPVGAAAVGFYSCLKFWSVRNRAFATIAGTRVTQGVAATLTQILLGAIGIGAAGLLSGHIVGQSAGIGALSRPILDSRRQFGKISLHTLKTVASRYVRFPLVASWGTLLNSGGLYMPAIALAMIYEPYIAGLFALAERMVKVPLTLVGNAAAQVYTGEAAEIMRTDPTQLKPLFLAFMSRLMLAGLLPAAILIISGPAIFGALFGNEWTMAGEFARILAVAFAVRMASSPLSQTLNVLERQWSQLVWEAGRLVALVAVFVIAFIAEWSPQSTVLGYSVIMALSYAIIMHVSYASMRQL